MVVFYFANEKINILFLKKTKYIFDCKVVTLAWKIKKAERDSEIFNLSLILQQTVTKGQF